MNRLLRPGVLVVALAAIQCSPPLPRSACVMGESISCACSDGRTGAQVCAADGMGYGACACASVPRSDGGDLGVDAGTPIAWADAWVAGFYGTPFQGVNVYAGRNQEGAPGGYYLQLRGEPGVEVYASVNDCSSFSDLLMKRSYGWVPPTQRTRPLAQDYYWAIRNGVHFTEITNVNDIRTGDVIALKYPANDSDTGHVAWVDAAPVVFTGPPGEPGLTGYAVTVIDSSDAFHDGPTGPTAEADNRYLGLLAGGKTCTTDLECLDLYGQNATCNSMTLFAIVDGGTVPHSVCSYTGVGRGQMRLYADATGKIAGFSWSPNRSSTFMPRPDPLPVQGQTFIGRDVVVGRYVAD
jgi:hypothetical protein